MEGNKKQRLPFPQLALPPVDIKVIRRNGVFKVYDPIRKKYIILSPEELVRQSFVLWLTQYLEYPQSLIANEIGLNLNNTVKRCDTVVFSNKGFPIMIIEFKAPSVNITQNVFDQIVRYNIVLKAPFIVVSNGLKHYCCLIDHINNTYKFLAEIPNYSQLKTFLENYPDARES